MKKINTYILEKLHINKGMKVGILSKEDINEVINVFASKNKDSKKPLTEYFKYNAVDSLVIYTIYDIFDHIESPNIEIKKKTREFQEASNILYKMPLDAKSIIYDNHELVITEYDKKYLRIFSTNLNIIIEIKND